MLGDAFFIYEMTINFKVHHTVKYVLCTKQNVVGYRQMLFFRKYKHIKYLCAMILRQIYLAKRLSPLRARVMESFGNVEGKQKIIDG